MEIGQNWQDTINDIIEIYSGGKWQELQDGDWPVCQDTTTTTEPPTTTPPFMSEYV